MQNVMKLRRTPLRNLFDSFLTDHLPELYPDGQSPATNIAETAEGYELSFEMPGFAQEDIQIDVHKHQLTVSAERKAVEKQEGTTWHRVEQRSGKWSRAITLPEAADTESISASYDRGMLLITLRKHPESQPRRVQIEGS